MVWYWLEKIVLITGFHSSESYDNKLVRISTKDLVQPSWCNSSWLVITSAVAKYGLLNTHHLIVYTNINIPTMLRNLRYRLDTSESVRRLRQRFYGLGGGFGVGFSYRRVFAVIFCLAVVLMYLTPSILRWMLNSPEPEKGAFEKMCLVFYLFYINFVWCRSSNALHRWPADTVLP